MARFNRQVLNHLTDRLPVTFRDLESSSTVVGGAVTFETPVNVFRRSNGYVVALTYGAGADWVRNARTAGVCDLITEGRSMRVVVPHIQRDEQLLPVPVIVRPIDTPVDSRCGLSALELATAASLP